MNKRVFILIGVLAAVVVALYFGSYYYRESVQSVPSPGAKVPEQLVRQDSPTLGPADAKVTIVEFYDPECEACAAFHPVVKSLLKEFDGKVRYVARYATFHKNAKLAAIYTEAAGEQGRYWEMQAKLFEKQDEWGEKHGAGAVPVQPSAAAGFFDKYATELGLNLDQLKASISDPKHAAKIDRDMRDVDTLNVSRTPTFFVNGRQLARLNQQDLRSLIREELAK
ncbi:MAG TPA: thioredoxin domain-containing protein [Pyrinomonadaceae bacterium]|nr:thioredoxin domain-containing protein [Pyrinomonadaceae bacterium]